MFFFYLGKFASEEGKPRQGHFQPPHMVRPFLIPALHLINRRTILFVPSSSLRAILGVGMTFQMG